ncbi:DUF4382 domain-containing protein [Hymenobacter koreensis]|uniref:DUF4382 domain-containing protein n=1 Tax=Hymenobacter koreensis TaxID=1084523 RepID=A0ABP8JGN7_9BACT
MIQKFSLYALALGAALSLGSCGNDNDKSSKLEIRLMDAPGDFQRVVLDVRQIEVHLKEESNPDGWQTLPFTAQAINVLEYVNGRSALLVSTDFAPGDLKEIRLVLGPDSYVIGTDGQQYDLKTPSGQTSGVKLKLDQANLRENETFQLLLDFDVARSIVERGNWRPGNDKKERYLLKPVIRVIAQAINGGLRGTVTPAAALPEVLAIRSSIVPADTFSTRADGSGAYQFFGIPSGTYTLKYFPSATAPANQPAYQQKTVSGVVVTNNNVTQVQNVPLN